MTIWGQKNRCNAERGSQKFGIADTEDGGRGPEAKECEQSPEAGKGQETDSPQVSRMESSPANTLVLAH